MYLLSQLWLLIAAACVLGLMLGFVLRKAQLQRRIDAVHRGAFEEQTRQAAELQRVHHRHVDALAEQAAALRQRLAQTHEQALLDKLSEQAEALQGQFGRDLHRAHAHWQSVLDAQSLLQQQAQEALARAANHIAEHGAQRQAQQAQLEQFSASHQAEAAALRYELALLKASLEEATVQRDQAGLRIAELGAELSLARADQASAEARLAVQQANHQALDRAQAEAAILREQLDAALIELSAAARARDAREAQRAQMAQQLALANDVRSREARIAAEQRSLLLQQLMDLRRAALAPSHRETQLEAQREDLSEQLTASRRTTRAAVLAAQQREARLAAELAELKAELDAARRRTAGQPLLSVAAVAVDTSGPIAA